MEKALVLYRGFYTILAPYYPCAW